jgi:hypothetical protein
LTPKKATDIRTIPQKETAAGFDGVEIFCHRDGNFWQKTAKNGQIGYKKRAC